MFYYFDIVFLFRYWYRCGHSECRQMLEGIYYVGKIPQIFRVFSKWAWSTTPFRRPKIAKKIGQIDSEFHETNDVLIFRQLLKISPSTFFARNLEKFREKNGNLFYYVDIVLLFRYWCRCGHSEYRQIFEGIFYVGQIPQFCGHFLVYNNI